VVGIKPGEIVVGSCNTIEKDSECGEITTTSESEKSSELEFLKKTCKGTVTESACSTENVIGTCRVFKNVIDHFYSAGPKGYTAETAKAYCEKHHGRWVTP
jgi:hypothetical protein